MRFASQTHDPATVISLEWQQMTGMAKFLVWIASPNMARAAKYLGRAGTPYTNAQIIGVTREEKPRQKGWLEQKIDDNYAARVGARR